MWEEFAYAKAASEPLDALTLGVFGVFGAAVAAGVAMGVIVVVGAAATAFVTLGLGAAGAGAAAAVRSAAFFARPAAIRAKNCSFVTGIYYIGSR